MTTPEPNDPVRPRVYIASRMTNGGGTSYDLAVVREAVRAADELALAGFAPMCPQLTVLSYLMTGGDYEKFMQCDFAWIKVSDILYRIPGESKGADREEVYARRLGLPVYFDLQELIREEKRKAVNRLKETAQGMKLVPLSPGQPTPTGPSDAYTDQLTSNLSPVERARVARERLARG